MNHKSIFVRWQKGLYLLFIAALIAGLAISTMSVRQVDAANSLAPKRTIVIEAFIDGRSQLILQKNTAQWYHMDFASPGRWESRDLPTIINGKEWLPVWPDELNLENYFCYCFSSTFKGVKPALHRNNITVELNLLEARGPVFIAAYPSASNHYALVIEFDDNNFDGAATYKIELLVRFGGKP